MINKVTLIGNLGRDPEVRHLENGSSVARLAIATNENYRDKEGNWQTNTEWHNVIAWRALADTAEKQLKKGSMVYVEGRLRTRSFKDNNGVEKYTTEIEANVLRSLDKRERNDIPLPGEEPDHFGGSYSKPASTETPKSESHDNASHDDLPF
ncbi:MAG TPA: single-stranded DNA-binding protein [Saprospiraceae bacterium]|nr:single-stranded DNA-binding protein [Saprospiraceae bacterium]